MIFSPILLPLVGHDRVPMSSPTEPRVLHTTVGDMPLEEISLALGARTWSILHTGAVISHDEELAYLTAETSAPRPFGAMVWPASLALAHEVASREWTGLSVLELGAGTGLPGIVAASLGARVVQTDRQKLVLHVGRMNAERNGVASIEHRLADWTAWEDTERYDVILGADILYADPLHPRLREIFEKNLAAGGRVLISDPFRATSVRFLEALQAEGWRITMDKWTVGITPPPRPVGVFALTRAG
jgi:methyltransferase-like protein 23